MRNKSLIILSLLFVFFSFFIIPFILAGGDDKSPGGGIEPLFNIEGIHPGSYLAGYALTPSSALAIFLNSDQTDCSVINSPTPYFVPTRTSFEWVSFSSFAEDNGIDIAACQRIVKEEVEDALEANQAQITQAFGTEGYTALVTAVRNNNVYGLDEKGKELLVLLKEAETLNQQIVSLGNDIDHEKTRFQQKVTSLQNIGSPFASTAKVNYGKLEDAFKTYAALPDYLKPNYYFNSMDDILGIDIYTMHCGSDSSCEEYRSAMMGAWVALKTQYIDLPPIYPRYLDSLNTYSVKLGEAIKAAEPNTLVRTYTYEYGDNYGDYCEGGACVTTNTETGETTVQTTPYFYCFTSDTLISTFRGQIKIKDVKIEDKIISFDLNTNKFVESNIDKIIVHPQSVNWYYLIKTANSQVKATGIHPFYVGNREYKQADELKIGEVIYTNVNGKLVQEEILSKEKIELPNLITVYNLELEENSPRNYFANNYLVHNKA